MKKVIQIVLAVVIVFLAFVVYRQLTIPLKFQKEVETRSAAESTAYDSHSTA